MQTRNRKRIIEYFCCLLVINLLVVPVTHASWIIPAGNADQGSVTKQHCEQMADIKIDPATSQPELIASTGMQPECEHGSACKLLCSIAVSMLPSECSISSFETSTRWIPAVPLQLNASFQPRLDRPPRL
jgi:uncharacterized ion transporter superfamily protein YfcC